MPRVYYFDYFTGVLDTYFIDEHPQLFQFQRSQNRAQKLLNYLGNVLVNGPSTPLATGLKPSYTTHPHVPATPISKLNSLRCSRIDHQKYHQNVLSLLVFQVKVHEPQTKFFLSNEIY